MAAGAGAANGTSSGDTTHEFAQAQYKARYALLTAGVDLEQGVTSLEAEVQGAVSVLDRRVFASNTIYDSFAVVDTGKIGPVHVQQENRDVGTTGSSGRLLVPDLRSYDLNHISVVPTDIAIDLTLDRAKREIRPRDRSGVVVRFEVKTSHAATLKLMDEAGELIPVGSTARLRGTGQVVPVGYDGVAYVEDLEARNKMEVTRPDGSRCVAEFAYVAVPGDIPSIGPLRCAEEKMSGRP